MRAIVVSCAGALVLCALAQLGCEEEERAPARTASPAAVAGASTVPVRGRRPPVTAVQPPAPQPEVQPPPSGAAEPQAPMPEQDQRARASEVVSQASDQIDRLERIQSMSADAHREGLDNSLYDLEHKREKVLQDMRELDVQPPAQRDAIRTELQRDLADLQGALQSAYRFSPAPSKGLPPPAPLPLP